MYHLSPFTYLIEALLGQGTIVLSLQRFRAPQLTILLLAVGRQLINCAEKELSTLQPPAGQSCGAFMAEYITNRGGYLTNPNDLSNCRFCSSRTTDQWMEPSFNIFYSHHWRDFGIFCAYILFNVRCRSLSCINRCPNLFLSTTDLPCLFPYIFCSGSVPQETGLLVEEGHDPCQQVQEIFIISLSSILLNLSPVYNHNSRI